jgi:hypothetical protein
VGNSNQFDKGHGCDELDLRVRKTVMAAIANSLQELLGYLEGRDLKSAEAYAARFLEILDKTPASTLELVGQDLVAQLRTSVKRGLQELREGAGSSAVAAFRSALVEWFATYPASKG